MNASRAIPEALRNPSGISAENFREEHGTGSREQGKEGPSGPIHRYGPYAARLATMDGGYAAEFGGGRP